MPGQYTFPAGSEKRGVGEHPHRGFETVTIVYAGEGRASATPPDAAGDWSRRRAVDDGGRRDPARRVPPRRPFTRSGGELKMIQLWVNLPAKDKMATPGYQSITAGTIPTVALANGAGQVRVIAGQY